MKELLRQLKLTYQVYNYFQRERLTHNLPLYRKYGLDKAYHSPVSSADFAHLTAAPPLYDRVDAATVMPEHPTFSRLPPDVQKQLLPWSRQGYAILPGYFSNERIDSVNTEITRMLATSEAEFEYANKVMFAHKKSDLIRGVAEEEQLLRILSMLIGSSVELFQSINFVTGSQQRTHSDSIHMTTYPLGHMIAAWVALEDVSPDSGPLHYYPGSHKLPYVLNADYGNQGSRFTIGSKSYTDYENHIARLVREQELEKQLFLAKKGDVLIWHANLLHGGEAVTNPNSTRRSMVLHYFANDAICYHEVTQRPALKEPR